MRGICPKSGTFNSFASSWPPPEPKISYFLPSSPVNHDMFSMTPRTVRFTFSAIAADNRATFCAAGCGVVTTYTSARGKYWLRLSAMSPVPGGMSTSKKSGSSQYTSVRNCSSALCNMGPRHTTAWPSGTKYPIEIQRTPHASGGRSI